MSGAGAQRIKKEFSSESSVNWAYFGKKYFDMKALAAGFGSEFVRIDTAKIQKETADELRGKHVAWMDEINALNSGDIDWWFGVVSGRNVYTSDIFQFTCYMEMLDKLTRDDSASSIGLAVVESAALAKSIKGWGRKAGVDIRIVGDNAVKRNLRKYGRVIYDMFYALTIFSSRRFCAFATRLKYGRKPIDTRAASVMVSTYIHGNSISADGKFKDRYMPYLHEYIAKRGRKKIIFPKLSIPGFNYPDIFARMRKSADDFIIQEDFLRVSDYIYAVYRQIAHLLRGIKTIPFGDGSFDLSRIVKEEKLKSSVVEQILIYRTVMRMARSSVKINIVIDWYENQTIDKALIAGLRRYYPAVKIVGAQMMMHYTNWLNLSPSRSETGANLIPDILLETGEDQCGKAKSFDGRLCCVPAAALRYSHVHSTKTSRPPREDNKNSVARITVLLSVSLEDSMETLDVIRDSIPSIKNKCNFYIRCHPDYTQEDVIESIGRAAWPPEFGFSGGGMDEALENSDIVIGGNTGALMEAAAKGLPVIFVGRRTALSLDPLGGMDYPFVAKGHTPEDIATAVNKFAGLPEETKKEYEKMGRMIIEKNFTPINDETLSPFLDA